MISVESRDGRRGLGLDFSGVGEMDETELEEGEASYYQDDDDANIDPDVALSYLDEKVQDVLGHFQKDFEGGVSAENLGAKFGGYGSFLPTHQRSPSIWSHARTPPKVQGYNTPRSPNNLPLEGARQNSAVSSSATSCVRVGPGSTSLALPHVSRAPFIENSTKAVRAIGEFTPKHEPGNKSINSTDQKTLKVRIKVGPDNMTQKNAAIYSGLGLDISPSSSLEDSPDESGGLSAESRDSHDESPRSILHVMTSFPIAGGILVSPLPNNFLHLMEKEKLSRESRSGLTCKGSQERPAMLVDEYSSVSGEGKVFGEKKMKPVEKSGRSMELKHGIDKDAGNEVGDLLRMDIDIETPAGWEIVSNSLNLPLLSNSNCTIGDTAKCTVKSSDVSREAHKGVVKDNFLSSDLAKEEILGTIAYQDANRDGRLNSNTSSADKVWEDRKASFHKDVQSSPRKDGRTKSNKRHDPFKGDFNCSKGGKDPDGSLINPQKDKVSMKATAHEPDGAKMHNGKERPSSGGKNKSKGSQNNGHQATVFPKEGLRVGSLGTSNNKKKSTSDYPSKKMLDNNKLPKESGKMMESHRDLSGDLKMVLAVNSLETPSKDKPKNSKLEVVDQETQPFADKSKERTSSKKFENQLMSEGYPKASQIASAPSTGNGPFCDVVSATGAPVVIEENWVCCDRCQKWRLLPFGTNPNSLPKKWLCSMLNWLPGMNRCNISEEETTKALNALYQVPIPENQNNLHSQFSGVASGITLPEMQHLDQTRQDHSLHVMPSGGKKKHGSKETSNSASFMAPTHFSNSTKKNQQSSMKSRSLNDVNQFPLESNLENKAVSQHLSQSSDLVEEKYIHKQKEKHKMVLDEGDASHLKLVADGVSTGDVKQLKMKIKKEADQDEFRASKKIKTEGLHYAGEDWNSDNGGSMGKAGPNSSNVFPAGATTGKHVQKYGEHSSSKDSKCDAKDSLRASGKKSKDPVQVPLDGGALDVEKDDIKDIAVKKRKVKEWQASQIYQPETLPNTGHHIQVNRVSLKEETSESELRKEKKARLSKSEGKESSTSKGDSRTEKRGRGTRSLISTSRDLVADGMEDDRACIEKDHVLGQYRGGSMASQRILDGKDLGYGQPSVAATSSSSKVSGSRKTKANFQEVKGSPVESVSSSPLRISNLDKVTSARRDLLGKDDVANAVVSVVGSPRRCSDGEEDGGSDRIGTRRKERVSSAFHQGTLESSVLDYQDRDAKHTSNSKAKAHTEPSSYELENTHLMNGGSYALDQHKKLQGKEHGHREERVHNNHHHSNGSLPRKSGKGSSSRAKDKQRSSKSVIDKGKLKVTDSFSEHRELYPTNKSKNEADIDESKDEKCSFQEKYTAKLDKDVKNYSCKKDSAGKWSSEGRRESQLKFGGHAGSDVKLGENCSKDGKSNAQENLLQDRGGERSSYQFLSNKTDREKSQLLPHSRDKQETQMQCPRPITGTHKGSGSDGFPVDASGDGGSDTLKVKKQTRKPDNQDGVHHGNLRHSTPNGLVVGDLDVSSPVRKDSSSHAAANAMKEAKDLKHSADRLKNSGSDLERTGLYFQAALKFLHGASLLEPCNIESTKHGETQSVQVYSDTAELFKFVAHEYERCKKMAAAALAYKCVEVAYMRVIYSKHSSANRDHHELQAALNMVPPGESSSSSASDVDNLNNQGTVDKVALAKGVTSPRVTGNHTIVAQNRPNFMRMLNFVQDVNFAMEASRKSQNAFAAANVSLDEAHYGESMSSVRRVLDFNFYDVQGLLRLVRLAMEAISL